MKLYCVQCVTFPHSTNSVHMTATVLRRWFLTAGYCTHFEATYSLLISHSATVIGGACNATKIIDIKISISTCKSWCASWCANVIFTINFKLCHEIGFKYTISACTVKNFTVPVCHVQKFLTYILG